jgi:hypothetical protein
MATPQCIHGQRDGVWIGCPAEFSGYWTQGETQERLVENLRDFCRKPSSGQIQEVCRSAELDIA